MVEITSLKLLGKNESCSQINLILGTNNTGKSTLLREISNSLLEGQTNENNVWITEAKIELSRLKTEFDSLYPGISTIDYYENVSDLNAKVKGLQNIFSGSNRWNPVVFNALKTLSDKNYKFNAVEPSKTVRDASYESLSYFTNLQTLTEFCPDRLSAPFQATINKVDDPYGNLVHYFYRNPDLFAKVASHIKEVFGFEIAFDDLQQGQKDIRITTQHPPKNNKFTQEELLDFWNENSVLLSAQGDGIKAYLKIIYGLFNPSKSLILIDEPEVFLHPPQRRSLGRFIAQNADSGKQIFIATHDSEFLRGILASPNKVGIKIFHLSNINNRRSLSAKMQTKLTVSRSLYEMILNAYFNKITILCEGEDDRLIYQYASEIYLPSDSIDTSFVGLNGKSDVIKHFEIIQQLGLNVACILDIDALYSNEILSSVIKISRADRKLLLALQNLLLTTLPDKQSRTEFKSHGNKEAAIAHLKPQITKCVYILEKYGIFIINGTFESWFTQPIASHRRVQATINLINKKVIKNMKTVVKKAINHI